MVEVSTYLMRVCSFGGREKALEQKAKEGASTIKDATTKGVETVKGAAKDVKEKVSSP
jgi:hypothetical protein